MLRDGVFVRRVSVQFGVGEQIGVMPEKKRFRRRVMNA